MVVDSAIAIHKALGSGLYEIVYEVVLKTKALYFFAFFASLREYYKFKGHDYAHTKNEIINQSALG